MEKKLILNEMPIHTSERKIIIPGEALQEPKNRGIILDGTLSKRGMKVAETAEVVIDTHEVESLTLGEDGDISSIQIRLTAHDLSGL